MPNQNPLKAETVREALKRCKAERLKGDLDYIRFREDFRGISRGTVIVKDRVIPGYPHIRRIFTLQKGLGRNIGPGKILYAEEKIDGFNVRIASVGGRAFAFSRGGFLDLFVTEKARESRGMARYLADNPDSVICGEMLGCTPYTRPDESGEASLFVFDIVQGDGSFLPVMERYSVVRKYRLTGVPVLGKFQSDDFPALKKTILSLNKGRKEGMVLKTADRMSAVKYVTPWSDIDDIAMGSGYFFDMPIGFFYQRILRSAFFIDDFGLDRDAYAGKLGRSFYGGLCTAIRQAAGGEQISEEFEIAIRDMRIWDDIRRHMSRDVGIELLWKRQEKDGRTRIRFRKIFKKTTKTLASFAGGKAIED